MIAVPASGTLASRRHDRIGIAFSPRRWRKWRRRWREWCGREGERRSCLAGDAARFELLSPGRILVQDRLPYASARWRDRAVMSERCYVKIDEHGVYRVARRTPSLRVCER